MCLLNARFCILAEHLELRCPTLQSVGAVVQQHTADRSVRAQWMAGAKLWRLWAGLGSAGLQVSGNITPIRNKQHCFLLKGRFQWSKEGSLMS